MQWTGIKFRTGIEGFYITVRVSIDDYSRPQNYFSDGAKSFFKNCLHLDPDYVGIQFESWVTAGLSNSKFLTRSTMS